MRQEWSSLSKDKQHDYINAALCLRNTPSKLHLELLYMRIFRSSMMLLEITILCSLYESSLRSECGYKGSVPYWDWSLDWKYLSQSPVFQNSPGFGYGGNLNSAPSKEAIVGGDGCVVEGPWAGMIVHWWTQSAPPYCLSRGFQDVKPMNEMGRYFSGGVLEEFHN
ncbi:hypothetical protein BKA61DRAFT_568007 [Leptodontidium sp. MPI-SDFR-AT-0119]|nr:hypothetical protein BKA61DRAFT_568007 [Leptodontidium sp. MPI-SDFR-AT-0119]